MKFERGKSRIIERLLGIVEKMKLPFADVLRCGRPSRAGL